MAQAQAQPQPSTPKRVAFPKDGKQRIFLYVNQGDEEKERALTYLEAHYEEPPQGEDPDAPVPVRKTNEIRLDRLGVRHVVIPIVRDVNRDRKVKARVPSGVSGVPDQIVDDERRGEIKEGSAVRVSEFYRASDNPDEEPSFDQNGFVNALGRACVVGGNVLAVARVERRGDGKGNHVAYVVLRLG